MKVFKHLVIVLSVLFSLLLLPSFSNAQQDFRVVCPSDFGYDTTQGYYLKCQGVNNPYGHICIKSNPSCPTGNNSWNYRELCTGSESCEALDAYSPCVKCVKKSEPQPTEKPLSRVTEFSGTVSSNSSVSMDSVRIKLTVSADNYSYNKTKTFQGGSRSIGYIFDDLAVPNSLNGKPIQSVTFLVEGIRIGDVIAQSDFGDSSGSTYTFGQSYTKNFTLDTTGSVKWCPNDNVHYCDSQRQLGSDIQLADHTCLNETLKCFQENPTRSSNDTPATSPNPGTGGGTNPPARTCTSYVGVACGTNLENKVSLVPNVVESGSTEPPPYKNGAYCGTEYYDVWKCSDGTYSYSPGDAAADAYCKTYRWCSVDNPPTTLPTSCGGDRNDICKFCGGIDTTKKSTSGYAGYYRSQCGGQAYDANFAAPGGPYCNKPYEDVYWCRGADSRGRKFDVIPIPEANETCNKDPWCPSSSTGNPTNPGISPTNPVTPGNPSNPTFPPNAIVGPIDAKPSRQCTTTKFCQDTFGLDSYCTYNYNSSGTNDGTYCCKDGKRWCPTAATCVDDAQGCGGLCPYQGQTCTPVGGGNCCAGRNLVCTDPSGSGFYTCQYGSGGPTTPAPTNAVPASPSPPSLAAECPTIDSDRLPNTCSDAGSCPPGYTYKGSPAADQACTTFRSDRPSWCCHKDQAVPTSSPGTALDPACPTVDNDGKPNTCATASDGCPAGYVDKNSALADEKCSTFRGVQSICCHKN